MSYALATLWYERQRFLPGVLAVGFSALLIALQCGLLLGLFDFVMYFLQMWIPALELGWVPDIAILVVVTVAITLFGVQRTAPSPQKSSQTPS